LIPKIQKFSGEGAQPPPQAPPPSAPSAPRFSRLRRGCICTSWSRRLHNTWIVGCQVYSIVN